MEQLSNKPRSFFTPKKLYLLQKQQEERANQESTTSSNATMVCGRGEKKLPESITDAHPASEIPVTDEQEPEVFHSPTKRSRGKTGKHLRLLAALDKDKSKAEQPPEAEAMENEPAERVFEPGCSGHGETGKRPGAVAHPKELQVKKQCEKKLSPGKDMHALMGTSSGRGRGRGRGRPPKSSYDASGRYPTSQHNMEDTAPVFNVNPRDGSIRPENTSGPNQRPCRRPASDSSHEGPSGDVAARGRLEPDASTQRTRHSHPSGMCDEITSSGDTVRAFTGPGPTAGQWDQHQAKDAQTNDMTDKTSLVKVEPDSQRVGNVARNVGEQHSCMVCGDIAAGFHCGAYVCEACKKFFVRCLKQDVGNKFMCSKNKMCVVNRETRTQCQYCRYQKCISLGMYKPGSGPGGGKFGAEISHIPCKVCESPSSGYHFGAITCEGCKGFFRRTVKERSGVRYVCSRSGACNITVNTRNVCKYCRYQKCLQAGMTPDGSRIGRQPNAVKHATMLELQRLGSGSTSTDTNLIEIKQEQASPPSENQDSGFPDSAQFEMIDPSNLPEELYLPQSEEEGKLRAIKTQPFSPSEVLDLGQPEPEGLKLYKPAYSNQQDVAMREQSQFPSHREQSQFVSQYLEPGENPHTITISPLQQVNPQPRSFRESQQLGKDIQDQQMQGYADNEDIYRQEQAQREQAQREQMQAEQAERQKSQREQMQREQAERVQMQREMAQREQMQRDRMEREQLQREQAQREQVQREQMQREQMQREHAQREQMQRDQMQREKAQREQMQREQAQREQMQREQAQREQAQREQQTTLGQGLQSLSVQLDPRLLQPKAGDVGSPEYQEHIQRLARIEALNAEQQDLKRQEQEKAMELKMEISKLASHSKYMMEISQLKASGDERGFVGEKPFHGKPLSAAAAMDVGALQRKEVPRQAPSLDASSGSYTSPDSAHFSMSPENEWSPLDNKSMNNDVFQPDWCVENRSSAEILVERGKDLQAVSVSRPSASMSSASISSDSSTVVSQTETSPQMPTDLSTKSFSRSNSGVCVTKASPKDCIEIINRVPNSHRALIEVIRKASLLLRPILEKNPDCKPVNLEATAEEMWDTMMNQFNQCARSVIQFARKVPGFLQFPVTVQITKVQMAMYPIVLTVLSTQYNMETKVFNYFHMTPKERDVVFTLFPGYTILSDHFHAMGHSVKYVEMDDIEIAFFCAVILITADAPGQELQDPHIRSEDLITALSLYCAEKEGTQTNRDGYILARLAEVNRCNAEHQKAVLNVMMMHPTLKVPQLYEETYLAM